MVPTTPPKAKPSNGEDKRALDVSLFPVATPRGLCIVLLEVDGRLQTLRTIQYQEKNYNSYSSSCKVGLELNLGY